MSNQKSRALQIIEQLSIDCQLDPELYRQGEYQENVTAIASSLQQLREAVMGEVLKGAVNIDYSNYDKSVIKLLILSQDEPVIFHQMFANAFGGLTDLRTIAGLTQFTTFLWLIRDDHSYMIDNSSGLPVVHNVEDDRLHYIRPNYLYSVLSKLC
jgi:hypothetical protein